MNVLRTVVSALCILVGGFLIASWAISSAAVNAVEDGTAVTGVVEKAMDMPAVVSGISDQVLDSVVTAAAREGTDLTGTAAGSRVADAVDTLVESAAFEQAVVSQVALAHQDFSDQLTDSLRQPAPLTISVDISSIINARLADSGPVAQHVPTVTVQPVTFQALSAERFEQVRGTYGQMVWAKRWGLWLGLALIVTGMLVSPRRRWFLAKLLFVVGGLCLALAVVLTMFEPQTVATFLPGGEEGALGALWLDVLTEESAPVIRSKALTYGLVASGAGLVALIVGSVLGGRRR